MIGTLGNIQTKIVVAVDRDDAESLVRKLFTVNGERVEHTVSDDAQKDRTHPVFYSLQEEWKKCVQTTQNLPPRTAMVKTQSHGLRLMRTVNVEGRGCCDRKLENIKRHLANANGCAAKSAQQYSGNPARHRSDEKTKTPVFWETHSE